ncbi:A/G-specific adenine glycosylase [Kiloniella sp. b19]|uniref:A/G-specific adenine glycosylase n=1 Tax=Kiloniella sp. GXU_MW_B19 TaxID=3141326 RepID=UPI0031CE2E2C
MGSEAFSGKLLEWYDHNARELPWRMPPGRAERTPAYRVWLSEIMLQQTTVAAVKPYFANFTERWPTVADLAAAPLDDVLAAWAGLGYYARARNLHRCAQVVVQEHGGLFPAMESELLKLPGVGAYTAAAIASIAFGQRAVVVDGNVERVITRQHALEETLPKARKAIRLLADDKTPDQRAGDYAQALMDLGATVCTPRNPACVLCPVLEGCQAQREGTVLRYPLKEKKKPKPTKRTWAYVVATDTAVFLRRRDEKGMLGGMTEVPTGDWLEGDAVPDTLFEQSGPWERLNGIARHSFTHFDFEISVAVRHLVDENQENAFNRKHLAGSAFWADRKTLGELSLPTVMKKILKLAKI